MEKREIKKIGFYCKKCGKSLKMEYFLSGDMDAPVLSNMMIRCSTNKCTRVMTPKRYTEWQLIENTDKEGRFFI